MSISQELGGFFVRMGSTSFLSNSLPTGWQLRRSFDELKLMPTFKNSSVFIPQPDYFDEMLDRTILRVIGQAKPGSFSLRRKRVHHVPYFAPACFLME